MIIFIDLFCGAGGVTTGIERAKVFGKKAAKVIACVNHDPIAIKSHAYNHKHVLHFVEDIRILDLTQLERLVDFYRQKYPHAKFAIWASLECTNFSKAKGGKPRDADSRTLAEHLFRYIHSLNPDYIFIENVVEFMSWGPLDENGRPISRYEGRDFIKWKQDIEELGFRYDHKVLNAADYGAYTKRERYFAQFAKGDLPIQWPAATHSKNPTTGGLFGSLKKWRPVKDVLDFSDEGNSVFNRKKPLSPKTMQRLFMGSVKHIAGGKENYAERQAFITKWNGNSAKTGANNGCSIEDPLPVITTQNRLGLATACFISKAYSGSPEHRSQSLDEPAGTLTTIPNHQSIVSASFVSRYNGVNGGKHDNSQSVEGPVGALGTGDNHAKVTAHFMAQYYSGGGQHASIDEPAATLTTKDRLNKVQADFFIDKYYSGNGNNQSIEDPAGSILPIDKHNLVKAEKHYLVNPSWGQGHSTSTDQPCPVVIARQDKAPLYLITCKEGPVAVPVYDTDCEWTIKLKEFMALYGIADIKMRMLKVPELLRIQGFPKNYYLAGTQADQKKFIGNSVVPHVAEALIAAASIAVKEYQLLKIAA